MKLYVKMVEITDVNVLKNCLVGWMQMPIQDRLFLTYNLFIHKNLKWAGARAGLTPLNPSLVVW